MFLWWRAYKSRWMMSSQTKEYRPQSKLWLVKNVFSIELPKFGECFSLWYIILAFLLSSCVSIYWAQYCLRTFSHNFSINYSITASFSSCSAKSFKINPILSYSSLHCEVTELNSCIGEVGNGVFVTWIWKLSNNQIIAHLSSHIL